MTAAVSIGSRSETDACIAMVHGMSQDHRIFDKEVEAFRDRYNIVLIDLPGHGLASDVGGPFGHVEFMRHVEAALDDSCLLYTSPSPRDS